jgi:hypothetical protein
MAQKSWSQEASSGLTQAKNSATIRQNIIDWIDQKSNGWALNSTQTKSFNDTPSSSVLVTVTKTGASKVSIEKVEIGF